jgi:hypothetical protein
MSLRTSMETRSVRGLIQLACVLALAALVALCVSVIVPRPIPVIFAMSVGHATGIAAFSCYLLAVVLDAARRENGVSTTPPASEDNGLGIKTKETGK